MKTISASDSGYICDIQAPCFQALSQDEVALIQQSKTQVQFRKDDNLTKQGTFSTYVLFMIKGLAIQYIEDGFNKSYNLGIIRPGEFVGLSSAFSGNTFNYSSVALNDCQAVIIEKSALLQIIAKNGTFGLSLIKRYTEQRMDLFETLRTVLYKQMMGRIAKTLLYLHAFTDEFPEIFTLLSRKYLADFAGITTESCVKILKSLDKEDVIKLKGKDIALLNLPYLHELAIKG